MAVAYRKSTMRLLKSLIQSVPLWLGSNNQNQRNPTSSLLDCKCQHIKDQPWDPPKYYLMWSMSLTLISLQFPSPKHVGRLCDTGSLAIGSGSRDWALASITLGVWTCPRGHPGDSLSLFFPSVATVEATCENDNVMRWKQPGSHWRWTRFEKLPTQPWLCDSKT